MGRRIRPVRAYAGLVTAFAVTLLLTLPGVARPKASSDSTEQIEQLQATIRALEARVAALEGARAGEAAVEPATPPVEPTSAGEQIASPDAVASSGATLPSTSPAESAPDVSAADLAAATEALAADAVDTASASPPAVPILSGAGGKNFLNLSLDGLIAAGTSTSEDIGALQTGGHDPTQRGFTVQNVEAVFEGAVDPYFRGQANVILQIDPDGETVVELEEVYATTTSLPLGLQLKAGQFFTEFGRLNPSHPHSWDFVDQPLVNGRFFGPDGLRSVGARMSALLPTDFYSEAMLTVQNSQGETLSSFRSVPGETLFGREIQPREVASVSDLLIVPRYALSFDLSDTKTILLGATAALGPNGTGNRGRTRIYGLDGFWKWKPVDAFKGFPFVKVQGELMRRGADLDASADGELPRATFDDWGSYLQVSWGYKPGYVLGLRLDRVAGDRGDFDDPGLAARWRLSPAFSWFPTEFSKLRLQYNFDRSDALRDDEHSLWLQLEFLLGAHAAHKF
jgi:hypothetical protein